VTLDFAKTSPTNVARLCGFGKEDKNAMSKKKFQKEGAQSGIEPETSHMTCFQDWGQNPKRESYH
jgi:hypothetical protein